MALSLNDNASFSRNPAADPGAGRSGYQGGRLSPAGMAGAVALHVGVVAILVMLPNVPVVHDTWTTLTTTHIPAPEPDKIPPPPPDRPIVEKPAVLTPKQIVQVPTEIREIVEIPPYTPPPLPPVDLTPPPADPPLVAASADPRAAFQPDYPPSMIRIDREGQVVVRVHISATGQVASIERISATDDAFWIATRRQALSQWRFRPATRGGVAVESDQTLTVHFKMP